MQIPQVFNNMVAPKVSLLYLGPSDILPLSTSPGKTLEQALHKRFYKRPINIGKRVQFYKLYGNTGETTM